MRLYSKIIIAGLLVMAAVPFAPVLAQSDKQITINDVDLNHDGMVSPAESKLYLDKISRAPAVKIPPAQQQPVPASRTPAKTAVAAANVADLNKDGKISAAEKQAYYAKIQQQLEAKFQQIPDPYGDKAAPGKKLSAYEQQTYDKRVKDMKALDINKDGILDDKELQKGAAKKFTTTDKNGDGILSQTELDASLKQISNDASARNTTLGGEYANRVRNRYKNADTNRDGKLSKDEYENYSAEYETSFDRNGDGRVTKEEFRSDGEKLPSTYFQKK